MPDNLQRIVINSSSDGRQEQQLIELVGRVADTERLKKEQKDLDSLESAMKLWVNALLPVATTARSYTLTGNHTVSASDPALMVFDCGGGGRTIFLPRENKSNKFYIFINESS